MHRNTAAVSKLNPAIATWTGPLGLPDFSSIDDREFEAAFAVAFPAHLAEIEAITNNGEEPTFENTIAALELPKHPKVHRCPSSASCRRASPAPGLEKVLNK